VTGHKPSRAVTCVVCEAKFKPTRRDARYCSARCRQRAARARVDEDTLPAEIDAAKAHYWTLVQRYAEACGITRAGVCTAESQTVEPCGHVLIRGELVGRVKPERDGWAQWGLEAAGPPYSPPTAYMHETFGPPAIDRVTASHGSTGGAP
jgi:predicted nucleic acid-binding Zn ribbon protein